MFHGLPDISFPARAPERDGGDMYCSCCGTETAEQQKFCRSCGLSLQTISQEVTAYLAANPDRSLSQSAANWQQWLKRPAALIGLTGLATLLLLLFSTLISVPLGKALGKSVEFTEFFDSLGSWVAPIALLLLSGGGGVALYPLIVKELFPRRSAAALPQADTTSKLESADPSALASSITEHTTRTLEPAPRPQTGTHE